jgi:hypothetical protein
MMPVMGASFTNYQIYGKNAAEVKLALASLDETQAYVSPEKNGWVTVYEKTSESQNEDIINKIAAALSRSLGAAVFAFLVHDSGIAVYWLYQGGNISDEFNSAPDYFDDLVSEEIRTRTRGRSDLLLPLCIAGTTLADIDAILHPADGLPLMAENILTELAKLLGIDDLRIGLGFEYFEGEEILPDAATFEPVGKKLKKKKNPQPKRTARTAMPAFDTFPIAISMLMKRWDGEQEKMAQVFSERLPGQKSDDLLKQLRSGFDRAAKDFLKQSQLPGLPSFEELKTARDAGPDALAVLLIQRAATQLGSIADGAIHSKMGVFIAALLANGLDPNTLNQHGQSILSVAERLWPDSPIYQHLKSAAEREN